MIEIDGLTKIYKGGIEGIIDFSLTVGRGELFCLLGPNGSGKTTTISMLFNFFPPTRGTAQLCGHDVVRDSIAARKVAAYVPENVSLYGNLTAQQNLAFFAELGGVEKDPREASRAALASVGLPKRDQNRRVREFSKGMRQKVGLAIALVRDCPVIVLDEPTSGLDPQAAEDLMVLLRRMRDDGRTIMMLTHDIFRVELIADRVGILRAGRLVRLLEREELRSANLASIYLATMEMDQPERIA